MSARHDLRPTPLRVLRTGHTRLQAPTGSAVGFPSDSFDALGILGCAPEHTPSSAYGLPAQPLSDSPARVDVWGAGPAPVQGRSGAVHWRHDGHWLYGTLALDEDRAGGLAVATHTAYTQVFACLRDTGMPALLRVWNYLPRINEPTLTEAASHAVLGAAAPASMERYRVFNIARQQAFFEAGAAAFEGAPAACAIGTRSGPICLNFLAARVPGVQVENPRQVSAYRYPSDYGPRSPSFSRAALCHAGGGRVALLISGTSSIVGHASLHAGDARAQTRETLTNLRAVIDAAHAHTDARFALADLYCTVYVRRTDDAAAVRAEFEAAVGVDSLAAREAIYIEADICRDDLFVEIEAHAFAPGEHLA